MSTKKQINFYASANESWKLVTEAAHQFTGLSAITYDDIDNIIYFNDQANSSGTIHSLSLSADNNHRVEQVIEKTANETIQGIAFDPLERTLYWTDATNRRIYHLTLDHDAKPKVFVQLAEREQPFGLAIDVCRRQLYWTNANHKERPSIERIALDGYGREQLIASDLFFPSGIVVDQYAKRIFWVDDLDGTHYAVESAALDGSDRRNIVRKHNTKPFNLAVDEFDVYWTDTQESE